MPFLKNLHWNPFSTPSAEISTQDTLVLEDCGSQRTSPSPSRPRPVAPFIEKEHSLPSVAVLGYRTEELLGQGDHSVVFCARRVGTSDHVALKISKQPLSEREILSNEDGGACSDMHEADHPGVAMAYLWGTSNGYAAMAREFVRGWSLQSILDRTRGLPLEEVLDLGVQTAEILEVSHLHGRTHGHLVATNLFVEPSGGVRITDWSFQLPKGLSARQRRRVTEHGARRADRWQLAELLEQTKQRDGGKPNRDWTLVDRSIARLRTNADDEGVLASVHQQFTAALDWLGRRRRSALSDFVLRSMPS